MGVTRQSVSKWELGQGMPEAETLPLLSDVLAVSLDVLM
ncbi:MAG: helix-turn-helix domain-containing protein [Oscillospiraceae bacterium]